MTRTKKQEQEEVVSEVKQESAYVPKKTNRGLIAALIIAAVVVVALTVIVPIAFMVIVLFMAVDQTEFTKVDENTVELDNAGIRVTVEDSRYDEKDNCYVLSTKVLLTDRDKYKKADFLSDSINVTYSFIDGDGYVVGSEVLYIGNLDKYDKWKQTISFCGDYASSVRSYEVESVDSY